MNSHEPPTGPFEVIPVIDLMGGLVVHARLGDRAHYQPIRSRLCKSARIEDVLAGLLGVFEFDRLYIADLDALRGGCLQRSSIEAMRRLAPGLALWIDAGIRHARDLSCVAALGTPVLACETLTCAAAAPLMARSPDAVLSIDYRGEQFLGTPDWLQRPQGWPAHLIAMNLGRVGSGLGPDLHRVAALRRLAPHARLYAAGGVRSLQDLHRCRQAGAAGALVASALHEERIRRADLAVACPGPRGGTGPGGGVW